MKISLRIWMWRCFVVAILATLVGRTWYPDPVRMIKEPVWVMPDAHPDALRSINKALQGPAPEIITPISIKDLVEILNQFCPATYSELELEEESISPGEKFRSFMRPGPQTMERWLSNCLKEYQLTYSIHMGTLHIGSEQGSANVTRIYPHPNVSGFDLQGSIESHCNSDCWQSMGGTSTYCNMETPVQSLIVISADYSTHRKIETMLLPIYESAGLGWRSDAESWTQLPRAILNRLTKFIDPPPPSPPPMQFGGSFAGGMM